MEKSTAPVVEPPIRHAHRSAPAAGALVATSEGAYYRVTIDDSTPPFLISLVSDSDHWMFISSRGGLTAGRRSPDHAFFPYYTDDRIHDDSEETGSRTVVRFTTPDGHLIWEPFSIRSTGRHRTTRSLAKATVGNAVRFEETNHDLGLSFAYAWSPSDRFGFVRTATLTNHASAAITIDLLDGIQNLLPAGIDRAFQEHYSTLVDGYKDNELDPDTGLALFRLSSVPTDGAEPREALRTTTVWSCGLDPTARLLCTRQLARFRAGQPVVTETRTRGQRGAYLLGTTLILAPGETRRWIVVAEVEQDAAAVIALRQLLRSDAGMVTEVAADLRRGTAALTAIVAAADGLQVTADELSSCRHFSNTLFNVMRGGIPTDGYHVSRDDFTRYAAAVSTRVAAAHADLLAGLPERLTRAELLTEVCGRADPALERLAREYLPLAFSRRHGDPSRPWNDFTIALRDEQGGEILGYQGNWRDLFQNWEALAHSYPGYAESMIFKFLNASTADGHNPYRLTREGFEWETLDPDDPWSHVGYWGDHQAIYLLKLLEVAEAARPGAVETLLDRRLFSYAVVPYRIRPYPELLADPRHTIDFDDQLDAELTRRVAEQGTEGALLPGPDGTPLRVSLAEKLLLVALTKLGDYIPGAGIWMNTQRPEWNDANNALVGYGVSMVTLYQLRRYLAHCHRLFSRAKGTLELSTEVTTLFQRISTALTEFLPLLIGLVADPDRRRVLDTNGVAASEYRAGLYAHGLSGERRAVAACDLAGFCATALRHIDHSIRTNRRPDGLYHAYNLIRIYNDAIVIRRLHVMLEGQVAVLGSGVLELGESLQLLDSLRASALYRADQNSYLLYPDRQLPLFLDKNVVPPAALEHSQLLSDMVPRGDRRIVVRDVEGGLHFNAAFRNAGELAAGLAAVTDPDLRPLVDAERRYLLDLYNEVFDHQAFTGRSGTFYKYEGLGCVYWHMVSKLLLAIGELLDRADARPGVDPAFIDRLRTHYEQVRDGLGVHKSPQEHGAIPIDPYSHTPAFAGAQQPGMTGQVKEDILARAGELGRTMVTGQLCWRPDRVRQTELLSATRAFRYLDVHGEAHVIELPPGTLGSTVCQVPVVLHREGPQRLVITRADGTSAPGTGLTLDTATSAAIFNRTGEVRRLDVYLELPHASARGASGSSCPAKES